MPLKDEHLKHADKFKFAYQILINSQNNHSESIAILVFYRALHYVEALFCVDKGPKQHCGSHEEREEILRKVKRYEKIWKHYYPLKKASMIARYLADLTGKTSTLSTVYGKEVNSFLINHYLLQIEKAVLKRIKGIEERTQSP